MQAIQTAVKDAWNKVQAEESWSGAFKVVGGLAETAIKEFWSISYTKGASLAPYTVNYLPEGIKSPIVSGMSAVGQKAKEHYFIATAITVFLLYKAFHRNESTTPSGK